MSEHHKVVVIGSGPAGFTAGLYTSRANLDTVVFEGSQPGGQLTITTEVENYPGFPEGMQGPELMELFRKQANKFGAKSIFETITKVDFSKRPFTVWTDRDNEYTADALIISTGATAKKVGMNGEDTYWGFGISACATCDGFFYKGLKIMVVGGGDTAMEEALYLTNFAEKVTIVHRRQGLRASKIMEERARKHPKIDFMLDAVIDEVLGEENAGIKKVTGARIKNTQTGEMKDVPVDGIFYGIGHKPNTEIFGDVLDKDENGYLVTKPDSSYTNIPGVFACGDVQDHVYRQAITAAGSGCMAAIDTERWLAENE